MKKDKVIKRLYQLGIITLVTSFIWVALSGYHHLIRESQIIKEDKELVKPIQPNLQSDLLPTIQQRKEYTIEEVSESLIRPTTTPTPASEDEQTSPVVPTSIPESAPDEGVNEGTESGQLEEEVNE